MERRFPTCRLSCLLIDASAHWQCGAGWTFRKSGGLEVRREGCATIYGVPYSEHSNFEVGGARCSFSHLGGEAFGQLLRVPEQLAWQWLCVCWPRVCAC